MTTSKNKLMDGILQTGFKADSSYSNEPVLLRPKSDEINYRNNEKKLDRDTRIEKVKKRCRSSKEESIIIWREGGPTGQANGSVTSISKS